MQAKLIRKEDGLIRTGNLKFVVWNSAGIGKELLDKPTVGTSAVVDLNIEMLSLVFPAYNWLTSEITEVISDTEFKTLNSTYRIERKIKNEKR